MDEWLYLPDKTQDYYRRKVSPVVIWLYFELLNHIGIEAS